MLASRCSHSHCIVRICLEEKGDGLVQAAGILCVPLKERSAHQG